MLVRDPHQPLQHWITASSVLATIDTRNSSYHHGRVVSKMERMSVSVIRATMGQDHRL